jgi:hypothetical protein
MTAIDFNDHISYWEAHNWCIANLRRADWHFGYKIHTLVFLNDEDATMVKLRFL